MLKKVKPADWLVLSGNFVVRHGHLISLGALCLFLSGCSEIEMRVAGPAGVALPVEPAGDGTRMPVMSRPIRRQRRNAELGRLVRPGENTSCPACVAGSACCDFPLWLHEAQKYNGLYAGHDPQEAGHAARLRLFSNACLNGPGSNATLVKQDRILPAAALAQGKLRACDGKAPWSGVFAHWCLAHAVNPRTGKAYESLDADSSVAENWLAYGKACEPCFGAVMITRKDICQHIAFCVGAILIPIEEDDRKTGDYKKAYLGFGGSEDNRVGMAVFAASDIKAFRLPSDYRPCKEHFKLECSSWVAQYRRIAGGDDISVAL